MIENKEWQLGHAKICANLGNALLSRGSQVQNTAMNSICMNYKKIKSTDT